MATLAPSKYGQEDSYHTMLFNRGTLQNTLDTAGIKNATLTPYVNRSWLRPVVILRPELASGYIIEGTFPDAPHNDTSFQPQEGRSPNVPVVPEATGMYMAPTRRHSGQT